VLRRSLRGELELLDAGPGVLAYARGEHVVTINTAAEERPAPGAGEVVLETEPRVLAGGRIAAHAGAVTRG
jgi:hypothetical protein